VTEEDRPGGSAPWAPLEPGTDAPARRPRPLSPRSDQAGAPPAPLPWHTSAVWVPKAGDQRTGPLPLHPMTLSDILDGAFKLLKANWRAALLIAGAFAVPVDIALAFARRNVYGNRGLLEVLNNPSSQPRSNVGSQYEALFVTLLVGSLVTFFVGAALSKVIAASYLGGEETAGSALRSTAQRVAPFLTAWLLVHLLEVIAFPLCFFPGLVVMTIFVAVAPAMSIEGLGPIRAMRRSAALLWPRLFPVMGVVVLCGVVVYFVVNALGTIPATAALIIGPRTAWPLLGLASILGSLVGTPIVVIVATLLYFDGRIRQEGFDLQLMADDLARRPAT